MRSRDLVNLAFLRSPIFEVKQDNGWRGARVAFAHVDSPSRSIKRSLLGWIESQLPLPVPRARRLIEH